MRNSNAAKANDEFELRAGMVGIYRKQFKTTLGMQAELKHLGTSPDFSLLAYFKYPYTIELHLRAGATPPAGWENDFVEARNEARVERAS